MGENTERNPLIDPQQGDIIRVSSGKKMLIYLVDGGWVFFGPYVEGGDPVIGGLRITLEDYREQVIVEGAEVVR